MVMVLRGFCSESGRFTNPQLYSLQKSLLRHGDVLEMYWDTLHLMYSNSFSVDRSPLSGCLIVSGLVIVFETVS